jgi:hypothetical protein
MLYLVLLCLLLASPAWGAVAYDASSSTQGSSNPLNHSHTVTGANVVLYCAVSWNSADTVTSVTYNSVGMTSIASDVNSNRHVEVFRLIAPATGAHTVATTMSVTAGRVVGCISANGVDQVTPNGTAVTTNTVAQAISVTITIPVSGIGIDFGVNSEDSCPSGIPDPTSGSRVGRYALCHVADDVGGYGSTQTATGVLDMDWTPFGATSNLALVGVPLNAASVVARPPAAPIIF